MKQLEKVIEGCKAAYCSGVPIIYIATDNYNLVKRVAESDSMAELYYQYGEARKCRREIAEEGGNTEFIKSAEPLNFIEQIFCLSGEVEPIDVNTYKEEKLTSGKKEEKQLSENAGLNIANVERTVVERKKGVLRLTGRKVQSGAGEARLQPAVRVVYNFGVQGDNKALNAYIKKYISSPPDSAIRKCVVLLASAVPVIPEGLEPYIYVVDVPPLEYDEIAEIVNDFILCEREYGYNISEKFFDELVTRFKGMEDFKIIEILGRIKAENDFVCDIRNLRDPNEHRNNVYSCIKKEKEQLLKKTDILTYVEVEGDYTEDGKQKVNVGGLENLTEWIGVQNKILENLGTAEAKWGVSLSKGLIITGIPGCGKSLMAMYTAGEFNIPLIQMDMGSLQKKYHGESEASMRKALKLIEAMAPCVLWIDEIDKGFAGMKGSGEADGGASQRAMATFLTWMQTNKKPVFSFITSNDVTKIPSELLRLGRVGKKYSVAMPCCDECKKIFVAVLKKKSKKLPGLFAPEMFSEEYWRELLDGYCGENKKFLTGGDIDVIVNDAMTGYFLKKLEENNMQSGFYDADEFMECIKETIDKTTPYGQTNLKEIVEYYTKQEENCFETAGNGGVIVGTLEEELKTDEKTASGEALTDSEKNIKAKKDALGCYDRCMRAAILEKYKESKEKMKQCC